MNPPFNYDLHLCSLPGKNNRVMICFHGYGDNSQTVLSLKNLKYIEATLVSFNFPEYDIKRGRRYHPKNATFGTINELLPALYVMKKIVLEQGIESIDLYGFSAGGGALINVIGVLNTSSYDRQLKKIGMRRAEKEKLLTAIQKGMVILDTPLKSIEEIMDFRGSTEEFEILAENYQKSNLRPIDSLKRLKGLSLDILLHFQEKDEILSNRDDDLYIKQLKENLPTSKITVIIGNDGGHMVSHFSLWRAYSKKIASLNQERELYFQFMKTSQGKIAYLDSEGPGFPIVFVHGNSCSSEVFKKQLTYFSRQYRIIAVDLPGHGKSDDATYADTGYTIPGYARTLNEIIAALQLNPFAVIGFSLGGNIALQWTQISDRIKGIMMVSSAPMRYSEEAFIAYPPYEGSYAASPNPLTEIQAMQYMEAGGFDTKDPSLYFMIQDAMRTDGSARAKMVASVLAGKGVDETKIVGQLTIPLAIIMGENDPCVGIEYVTQLPYHNLWHTKIQLIPNAKHAVIYHQADQLNLLIEDFLRALKK